MKKILLSIVAFFALALSASAEQKACDLSKLPAASENTTWDAASSTFAWSTTWYNSMEVFGGNDYSYYDTFNYDVEAGSMDHFRIIVKFTNGAAQVTYNPAKVGKVSLTWAQIGVDAENLKYVETIRLSGANDGTGDVKVNSIYLEGTGAPKPTFEVPEGSTNVKALTGTNANWASTVVYPKEFAVQGNSFGDGDGSNEATWVDVTGFETMTFEVTNSSTGLALRAWMWDDVNNKVVTLYAYPEAEVETADFTKEYLIKAPGKYVVKFGGLTKLKGVKAANNWNASALQVGIAYVTPAAQAEPIEYTVNAKVTADGKSKTFNGQVIKVAEKDGVATVTLPAAQAGAYSMESQTVKVNIDAEGNISMVADQKLNFNDGITVSVTSVEGTISETGLNVTVKGIGSNGIEVQVVYNDQPTSTKNAKVVADEAEATYKTVKNGKVVIVKDGKAFTAAGAAVK